MYFRTACSLRSSLLNESTVFVWSDHGLLTSPLRSEITQVTLNISQKCYRLPTFKRKFAQCFCVRWGVSVRESQDVLKVRERTEILEGKHWEPVVSPRWIRQLLHFFWFHFLDCTFRTRSIQKHNWKEVKISLGWVSLETVNLRSSEESIEVCKD